MWICSAMQRISMVQICYMVQICTAFLVQFCTMVLNCTALLVQICTKFEGPVLRLRASTKAVGANSTRKPCNSGVKVLALIILEVGPACLGHASKMRGAGAWQSRTLPRTPGVRPGDSDRLLPLGAQITMTRPGPGP